MNRFSLTFPTNEIEALAKRYEYASDAKVRSAGRSASERGHYTQAEFLSVCDWKTGRSRSKVMSNSEEQVIQSTASAFSTQDERERMDALVQLEGVGVPTASALLQFAFPTQYPILDVRALESLGERGSSVYSTSYWLEYLTFCRDLAQDASVSIRTLDKALWQHSKER